MASGVFIPVLAYPDLGAAVSWLVEKFALTERLRIGDHRSQLTYGGGSVVVTASSLPVSPGQSIMVRVENVDRHFEQASQQGARIVQPPQDFPYGERQYIAEDLAGYQWTFSQSIADVDPATWGGVLLDEAEGLP